MTTKLTLDALLSDYIDLNTDRNIEAIDFTIECNPSLKVITKYNIRGKKDYTNYVDRNTDSVVVKKEFVEDYENHVLNINFTWYDRSNEVFATKQKIIDIPDEGQWAARFRKQRESIMDDLKGRAKKFGAAHYVDIIYNAFSTEKENFVQTGSSLFADSIVGTIMIDTKAMEEGVEKRKITQIQAILNSSLDGKNKVYETLVYLTTL